MDKLFTIVLRLSLLLGMSGVGLVTPSHAAEESVTTTFIGSTIEGIDTSGQMITIRTPRGSSWSLQVASADLMRNLRQGDRASLELDDQGRVKKIVKTAEPAEPKP